MQTATPPENRDEIIRQNELRFQFVSEHLNLLSYDYDLKLQKTNWIGSVEKITGYKQEEIIKLTYSNLLDLIHPDDRDEVIARMKFFLEKGGVIKQEYRFHNKDGSWIWVEDTSALIRDEKNNPLRVLGTIRNINEQKINENLIFLQTRALEAAANGILMTDSEGIIIWVNPAMETLTGFKSEEIIGKTPRIFKSGKQSADVYRELWKSIKSGNIWHGEFVNRRKDGSTYTDEQTITPVKNQKGEIRNFISIRQDVTARKKAELETEKARQEADAQMKQIIKQNINLGEAEKAMLELLQRERKLQEELKLEKESIEKKIAEKTKELKEKSEALKLANDEIGKGWYEVQKEKSILQSSISSLPVGFILTDKDNNIITVNDYARKLLKLNKEMINLNDIGKLFVININLLKMIETLKNNLQLIDIREATLGNRYIHISLVPVLSTFSEIKEFNGTVILIGDITERKMMDRSRDEFFSIASHELRTPLTSIRGNIQLIKDFYQKKVNDPEFDEMVSDIHESAIRLIDIVNDFLNTSRLEMNKIEFKKDVFSLARLIDEVCRQSIVQAKNKGLYLKFEKSEGTNPNVLADEAKTKEILINLLSNAIKFTQKGGITLKCRVKDKFIETLISDSGSGISLPNQFLLFKKFQQAENNIYTRDVTQGTGLGLYISRLLVKGMGGDIILKESTPDKGSTFAFTLPVFAKPVSDVNINANG